VTGGRRRLHNEELHNFHASPNIIRVIKLRRMRWAGNVACMGGMMSAYGILVVKPEKKRQLGHVSAVGRIILEWIFGKCGGKMWVLCVWLRIGTSGGLL
jgi:hypothetical protein